MLKNGIDKAQVDALAVMMDEHTTLMSLCGLTPGSAEADFSNRGLGPEDAYIITKDLKANKYVSSKGRC